MKIIHYAVVAVLVLGVLYYLWMKPPSVNPITDRRAAEALALVQTHQAQGYPTILQAMTEHVRSMSERNQVARLGEWRVKQLEGDLYEIRIQLRDQGVTGQWFEREFIWHADLLLKKVNAASLPAASCGSVLLICHTCRPSKFCRAKMVFPQPASPRYS